MAGHRLLLDLRASIGCRLEAVPGDIAISVGAFADPDFQKPSHQYWCRQAPAWFRPDGVEQVDGQ